VVQLKIISIEKNTKWNIGVILTHSKKNVFLTQYCAGSKIKKNEMGWACGAYRGGESCAQGFGGEA
jgi:hypothetical protein